MFNYSNDDALGNSRSTNQKVCVTIVNKYMSEEECQIILEQVISESEEITKLERKKTNTS